jgi:hypothetical protein
VLVLVLALAQSLPPGYVDPHPVLQAAEERIGASKLDCIRISGEGYAGIVGQGHLQSEDWPRRPFTGYSRTIDFRAGSSVETFTREPGRNPRSWKYGSGWLGGTPFQTNPKQTFVVAGEFAWHRDGDDTEPIPAPSSAELWQLDLWLNPPGFLEAAKKPGAEPKAVWRWELVESGRDGATTGAIEKVHVVSITILGRYRVNATINSDHLIQRIETKVPHPVLGDMNYEHEYTDWREIDGITFPAKWHHHEGYDDERFKPTTSGGHNALDGTFGDIRVNQCGAPPEVPESVRSASVPASEVTVEELAPGVWLLGGASHNSVAVDFDDFVAVVEAPLDEERSLAVIERIVGLAPGKPIRFVVNTHDHFDHLGGIRTYLHIGATVVTHKRNRVFFEEEVLHYVPRTLEPDLVTLFQPTEIREGYVMEVVSENYVVSDGVRNLHVSYVQPLAHVEGMLMAYLPREKIAIEADLADEAATPDSKRAFLDHVRRLGIPIETIVPIHGRPTSFREFLETVEPEPGR